MKTRRHADRKKPEDLRGRIMATRVPRELKRAFYDQCRVLGIKPCVKQRELIAKFAGVKLA